MKRQQPLAKLIKDENIFATDAEAIKVLASHGAE